MPLYQNSVLKKYLKQQDSEAVAKAFRKFTKYFHDHKIQENIRSSKEEEYQGIFLTELFSKILGYTMKPNANFNLVAEYKNEKNSRKADGAILKDNEALGVIELKGTNTKDLEKVRQQAFDYKANQTGCVYVITSNFEKIRFYINNAVDFEEFDLFNINQERFELLYLCLAQENLLNNVPLKIKEASVQEEEAITKKFYTDYSTFKRELFRDLVKLNMKNEIFRVELNIEDVDRANKNIKHNLFKKSQKLIDRFLFIFFAEDRGLLPPNSTVKILEQWDKLKELDEVVPLYSRYKKYFNYLDTGRKGTDKTAEIFAYNGGLFKPDPVLDSLIISDELLAKHTNALQAYDFESQVDVNILGHIFENSLNEIESVNAEIEGGDFDKQKSKRKNDGVFYTPKYITKYIVGNTVGKLCIEKKVELGVIEEEYFKSRKGRTKVKLKELLDSLEAYREWLLHITILDPACGSGAFLNQALDFLINEHHYIDELQTNLLGGGFVFPDIENTVLENNIFGVDLNEESVEIAKLSLWLRTAQPRRKLNNLSSNIKCGNSLIDSKTVAGDKAFKWEDEYPQIFDKGGFDVVIGNPPYVRVQTIKDSIESESLELEKNYQAATRRYDLFVLFMEKSYELVKESGVVNYIVPHKFLVADFGFGIRKFLREYKFINQLIHFGHEIVFDSASVYTCIVQLSKNSEKFNYTEINPDQLFEDLNFSTTKVNELNDEKWELHDKRTGDLIHKLKSNTEILENIVEGIYQGIKNTSDKIFMMKGSFKNGYFYGYSDELNLNVEIEADIMEPVAKGKDIKRYEDLDINYHVIYPHYFNGKKTVPYEEEELKLKFPKAFQYLGQFKEFLIGKKVRFKTNPKYWYSLHRSREIEIFSNEKIVTATIQNYPHFTIDKTKALTDAGGYALVVKPNIDIEKVDLLPILNSKLMWFFIKNTSSVYRGGYYAFNTTFLNPFPIPDLPQIKTRNFESYSNKNIELTGEFIAVTNKYTNYLKSQFSIEKLPKKLQNWHELEFGDFIKELNKAIKKVRRREAYQNG